PVFSDGKLFAWLYNCAHHREIGGLVAGSTNSSAESVYDSAVFFPPTKIVERGVLREDVLDVWTRRSRLPEIAALEVKAQLSGMKFARSRLLDILERYGASTVKRSMRKKIEDTDRVVSERLARLPDGEWRDECYIVGSARRPFKLCLAFAKSGDRLRVSNRG